MTIFIITAIVVFIGVLLITGSIILGAVNPHPHRHLVPFWLPEFLFLIGLVIIILVILTILLV